MNHGQRAESCFTEDGRIMTKKLFLFETRNVFGLRFIAISRGKSDLEWINGMNSLDSELVATFLEKDKEIPCLTDDECKFSREKDLNIIVQFSFQLL